MLRTGEGAAGTAWRHRGQSLAGADAGRRAGLAAGVAALVVAGAWPAAQTVRLLLGAGHVTLVGGDQALMEIDARRAWDLTQLLGPYSRFGWHHPGPALFYLLALPVHALGPRGPGLYLGTVLIDAAAALATVAWVWRRHGPLAALLAASALDALVLSVSVTFELYPWNPYVIVLPLALLAVLWADAVRGHLGALAWCAAVGSFVAQTHISAAPYAGLMVFVAIVACAARIVRVRRSPGAVAGTPGGAGYRAGVVLGLAAFVAAWAPVVAEVFRDQPNNVGLLWDFFTSPHAHQGIVTAVHQCLNALTILPFAYHTTGGQVLVRSLPRLAAGCLLLAAATGAGVWLALRRRVPAALWMIAAALIAPAVGIATSWRAAGGLLAYLVVWQAFAPAVILIALGVAAFSPAGAGVATGPAGRLGAVHLRALDGGRPRSAAPVALGLAAVLGLAATVTTVRSDLDQPAPWTQASPALASFTAAAERALRPGDHSVRVDIASSSAWPDAAGLVLDFVRDGRRTTVSPPEWVVEFGKPLMARIPVDVRFVVADQAGGATPAPGAAVIARSGSEVLLYQRDGSGAG